MASITELQAQIAELIAINERLEAENMALEFSSEGILVADLRVNLLRYNRFALDLWDLDANDLMFGMAIDDLRNILSSRLDTSPNFSNLSSSLLHPREDIESFSLTLVNGRIIEQHTYPLILREQQAGWIWCFRDMSQEQTILAFKQQQAFLDQLLSAAPMLLFATDTESTLRFLQGKELERLSFAKLGQNLFTESDLPILWAIQRAIEGESVRNVYDFDGIYLDVHCIPLLDENQEIVGMLGLGIELDSKDIAQLSIELQKTQIAAQAANMAKKTFLANMSHELRTPLNSILGFSQILLDDKTCSNAAKENIAQIMNSGQYLLSLINDILEKTELSPEEQINLEFSYSKIAETTPQRMSLDVLARRISYLPLDIRYDLREALMEYSLSKVDVVCKKIARYDSMLAKGLMELAKDFDFKTMLTLFPD